MADNLQILGKTYTNVAGIKAVNSNGDTLTFVKGEGGGGDSNMASGTVTLPTNSKTIPVDVDFEPTHAILYADFENWTTTSWNGWGAVVFDMSMSHYVSLQARINNGNFQFNTSNREISNITYSDGKFTFADPTFVFPAGTTYTWYAWRETR